MKMEKVFFLKLICISLLWIGISESASEERELSVIEEGPPSVEIMSKDGVSRCSCVSSWHEELRSKWQSCECRGCGEEWRDAKTVSEALCCPIEYPCVNCYAQFAFIVGDASLTVLGDTSGVMCCLVGAQCPPPAGPALMACGGATICGSCCLCLGDSVRRLLYLTRNCCRFKGDKAK